MQFSNDFYTELEERLPSYLLDFWGMRNFYHFCENIQYKDFIRESIDSFFGDIDESRLSDTISKLRTSQRKKKYDWIKKFNNSLENDYKDQYNPLSVEYLKLQSMSPQELVHQYREMSLDDIIEQKKQELIQKVNDWKSDKQSLFTQFPVMNLHTSKIKQNALKEDILTSAADYISKELKYDFSANVKMLPTDIAYKPFFSFSATNLDLAEIDGIIQNVVKKETDGSTFSVIPTETTHNLKNLDKKDYAVYQEIVHLATTSGRQDNNKLLVKINCSSIAQKLYNYAVNNTEIQQIKNSIYKLANRRFVYKKGNTRVEYVLVDSIIKSDDEKSSDMALLLGDVISNAILQKDIIGISKKMENKLSSPHAYAFIYALQGIRFQLFRDTPDNMCKDLHMDFFENCVQFNTRSFKKKVSIVLECLDDYMSHDTVIENYNYSNDIFSIRFLPIENDDRQYYNDWLQSHTY